MAITVVTVVLISTFMIILKDFIVVAVSSYSVSCSLRLLNDHTLGSQMCACACMHVLPLQVI